MIRTDWRYVGDDLAYILAMLIFYALLRSWKIICYIANE